MRTRCRVAAVLAAPRPGNPAAGRDARDRATAWADALRGPGASLVEAALSAPAHRAVHHLAARRRPAAGSMDARARAAGSTRRHAAARVAPHHRDRGRMGAVDGDALPREWRLRVPGRPGHRPDRP